MTKTKESSSKDQRGTELDASTLFTLKYKGNENGMTRALLQIIQSGGIDLLWYLAQSLDIQLPENYLKVITQKKLIHPNPEVDQPICDGLIEVHPFRLLVESKIKPVKPNDKELDQLRKYMAVIDDSRNDGVDAILLYITPNSKAPEALEEFQDYIVWASWNHIMDILKTYPNMSAQLSAMISGLQGLWDEINDIPHTIPDDKLVAVLAGRIGYPRALKHGIYNCQKGRTFRNAPYFAFYANQQIEKVFKVVEGPFRNDGRYPDLPMEDDFYLLEPLDGIITTPIKNDCKNKQDNIIPFTMGMPRYVDIDSLGQVSTISELKKHNNLK